MSLLHCLVLLLSEEYDVERATRSLLLNVVHLQNSVIGHPRFPDITGFLNLKVRKLLSMFFSGGCSPDQDPWWHQQSTGNSVWQHLVKWCLVKHQSCKINFMAVSFYSSVGVVSILVAENYGITTTARVFHSKLEISGRSF